MSNEIMTDTQAFKAIQRLPDTLRQEVFNFIQSLIKKQGSKDKKVLGHFPKFGMGKVQITISQDFDAPLEDFKDYM